MPDLKASITLDNLKHALKITALANIKASTIPILQGVRLEQTDDGLAVESTDLEIAIRVVLPELGGPQTAILTPHEKFSAWAKLLTADTVTMSADMARMAVKCGRAKATLPLLPVGNWPNTDSAFIKGDGVTLTQGSTARALRFTQATVADDDARYTLNGIKVESDGHGRLQFVSSEGHCMTIYSVASEEKLNLLLPGRFTKALLSLLTDEDGGLDMVADDKCISVSIDAETRTLISGKQIAGSFPNWKAIVPNEKRAEVTMPAAELSASLERVFVLSDKKSGAVDLIFAGGEVALKAASVEHGEAEETVTFTGDLAEELHTRINGDYLRALLRKLDGDITIALPDSNTKALLFKAAPHEGETLDYILMPMRV